MLGGMTGRAMNATKFLLGMSASALILITPSVSQADQDRGLQLALRTGFIFPFGDITKGILGGQPGGSFSESYTGFIPIVAEAGWRIDPNVFVGVVVEYALGLVKSSAHTCMGGLYSCSGSDLLIGVEGLYHFKPKTRLDPWAGVGTGYEWLGSLDGTWVKGFQFINLHVGIDFPVASGFFVAPFLTFAVGKYSKIGDFGSRDADISNTSLHELLTIGLRGSFNL
jgi:hypothetical protein